MEEDKCIRKILREFCKRNVMMKSILLLTIFMFTVSSFAEDVGLLSYSSKEVTSGDIVKLKIIDSRNEFYFKKFKNKRIGPLIYVVDLVKEDGELFFEAMVSEMGPKEKMPELSDKFILKGLNYYPSQKKQMTDFITLDIPIEIPKKTSTYVYIVTLLLIFCGSIYWFINRKKRIRKKKHKKRKEEEIERLKLLFNKVGNKENISQIYLERENIKTYFEIDEINFKKTMDLINKIQYQPSWPEDDYVLVCKKLKSISEGLQVKRGV